jgi:hypothetical protein
VPTAGVNEPVAALTAHAVIPGAEVPAAEGEGGRRRRRGRGRGRGDRGDRAPETMADLRAEFPAEAEGEENVAAPREAVAERKAAAPVAEREPIAAAPAAVSPPPMRREPEPEVEANPLPHTPQIIASFAPPPATYKEVSEHASAEEEPHRPVRRRRQETQTVAAEPLQLVETSASALTVQPVFEDEVVRRPVRRRRSASATSVPAEPLQLVETAPGAATDSGAPQA